MLLNQVMRLVGTGDERKGRGCGGRMDGGKVSTKKVEEGGELQKGGVG